MSKANELRIGNWLEFNLYGGKGMRQIDHTDFEFIFDNDLRCAKPIPLTEDWLVKLGFEKQMAWTFYIPITGNMKLVYYLGEKGWSIGNKEYSDHECEYVHELQNLYFALTGKELEMKGGENG
jgi:hypothetical protein